VQQHSGPSFQLEQFKQSILLRSQPQVFYIFRSLTNCLHLCKVWLKLDASVADRCPPPEHPILHQLLHLERFITDVISSTLRAFPPLLHLAPSRSASHDLFSTTHHTSPPCRSRRSCQTLPTATQPGQSCAQRPPRRGAHMPAQLPPASAYPATSRASCMEGIRTLSHEHGRQSAN